MRVIIFLLFAGLFFSCGETSSFVLNPDEIKYPESRVMDQVDTLWGVEVEDPYRWLEDDRDPEVEQWVIDQNTTTRKYLDALPLRNELRDRYEKLFNYEKVGIPRKVGDKYFIARNDGLQNQSVTYIFDAIGSEERVFLDPNTLSKDGTVTASLGGASDDGKYISVIKSAAGSDWQEIRVMDIETGRELDDVLKWVKFSGTSWVDDGFYYSRYPEPEGSAFSSENTFHSVYFHKIGTLQSEDELVYIDKKEPNRYHFAWATEDNNYLILNVSTGTDGNSLLIKDLRAEGSDWRVLVDGFTDHSGVVGSVEGKILLLTDIEAPKYRLVAVDPTQELTNTDLWTDIIPQSNHLLESVQVSAGRLFATFLRKACHAVVSYDFMGSDAKEIHLPSNVGSVGGFGGKMNSKEVFYAFTSFTHPTSIYKYDPVLHESLLFSAPEVNFNPDAYETKQVEFLSKDEPHLVVCLRRI
jgi:prolyl oligopeptidase